MPPKHLRRSHTKSKKGCSQCKVRRIKCNEQRPTCSNCERRQISCDFSGSPSGSKSPQRSEETARPSQSKSPNLALPALQPPLLDPFDQPDLVSTKKTTSLDITDLKLLHHFTTIVSVELSNAQHGEAIALWQTHAVKLGFKHDFLLRGILAVSAYHMSYSRPEKKAEYDLIASTHQSLALISFQDTLANVNESNCHALFAFSCLIIVMAFASSTKDKPSDFNTDVLQWFYLLRGANIVLNLHSDSIRCSFLKPLLDEMAHTENTAAYTIPDADRISDLFRICVTATDDRETSQAYTLAIHSLLSTFTQASLCRKRGEGTVLAGFVWPINLPPKFLDLLGEKKPEAMVILAHYCVVLFWGETGNGRDTSTWFMGGWARYMLETIKDSVPEQWYEHLKWPDEMVGNPAAAAPPAMAD